MERIEEGQGLAKRSGGMKFVYREGLFVLCGHQRVRVIPGASLAAFYQRLSR